MATVQDTWYQLVGPDGQQLSTHRSAKAAKAAKAAVPGSRVQMMATTR